MNIRELSDAMLATCQGSRFQRKGIRECSKSNTLLFLGNSNEMKTHIVKVSICCLILQTFGCSQKMDIYELCLNGDVKSIENLLKADPSLIDCQAGDQKETPLHHSIARRRYKVAKYLISKGANVNLRANYGETALHPAASGFNIETVRLLLDAGAEVNALVITPSSRATPLDYVLQQRERILDEIANPGVAKPHYVPRTLTELRAEEKAINNVIELLKAHGAKKYSALVGEAK